MAAPLAKTPPPEIQGFFHEATNTISYLVRAAGGHDAVIIDPVLDFNPATAETGGGHADRLIEAVQSEGLTVHWILETHVHADHLSAAAYLMKRLEVVNGVAIGKEIVEVQDIWRKIYNLAGFPADGRQFQRLLAEGDMLEAGALAIDNLYVPGHTPADHAYLIGDAVFVGDTLFMPDYGTARVDFPGGNAGRLYDSVMRLYRLPDATRVFLCHDYLPPTRAAYRWQTTIGEQRQANIHIHDGVCREEFIALRGKRDRTLSLPKAMLAAIQVNIRAGHLPPAEENGTSYLKLPLNRFGAPRP